VFRQRIQIGQLLACCRLDRIDSISLTRPLKLKHVVRCDSLPQRSYCYKKSYRCCGPTECSGSKIERLAGRNTDQER
jgi:hypothetical protein